jgi:hypothetical protein
VSLALALKIKVVIASKSRIGRIRRAVRRGFIVSGGKPIVIRQVRPGLLLVAFRDFPLVRRRLSFPVLPVISLLAGDSP